MPVQRSRTIWRATTTMTNMLTVMIKTHKARPPAMRNLFLVLAFDVARARGNQWSPPPPLLTRHAGTVRHWCIWSRDVQFELAYSLLKPVRRICLHCSILDRVVAVASGASVPIARPDSDS